MTESQDQRSTANTVTPHGRADSVAAALAELEGAHEKRNPESQKLYERAQAYMPGGNTRTNLFYPPFPLTIARGERATLWDVDGHKYADFIGEYTAGVYGHSAPEIREAVHEVMANGINLTGNNLIEGELAKLVCDRFASVERVRFTNSGTEANLMALNAALSFTGRKKIAVFEGGYHGGVIGFGRQGAPTNMPFGFHILPYNDEAAARSWFKEAGNSVAAVLVEPMLGASGCIPGDVAFLAALRELCTDAGALLIFDEVMTSRLSAGGLQGTLGIAPDLTTLGKYIGGGMSFGAFGGRVDVMKQFDPRTGKLSHAGTFNNNVVTMTAGITGLRKLFPPAVANELSSTGEKMRERLNSICAASGVALQFTGVGSVMNAHFTAQRVSSIRDLESVDARLSRIFFLHLLLNGFYIAPRGFIVLSLPLTADDIGSFASCVEGFVQQYGHLFSRNS